MSLRTNEFYQLIGKYTPSFAIYTGIIAFLFFTFFLYQFYIILKPKKEDTSKYEVRLYGASSLLLFSIFGYCFFIGITMFAENASQGLFWGQFIYIFSIPSIIFFYELLCIIFFENIGFSYLYSTLARRRIANFKIDEQCLNNLKSEGVPEYIIKNLNEIKNNTVIKGEERFLDILKTMLGYEQTDKYKTIILKYAKKEKEGAAITNDKKSISRFPNYYIFLSSFSSFKLMINSLFKKRVNWNRALLQCTGDILFFFSQLLFFYLIITIILRIIFRATFLLDYIYILEYIPFLFKPANYSALNSSFVAYYPQSSILISIWGGLATAAITMIIVQFFISRNREKYTTWPKYFFAFASFIHFICSLLQGLIGFDNNWCFPYSIYSSILLIISLVFIITYEYKEARDIARKMSLSETIVVSLGHTMSNLIKGLDLRYSLYRDMIFKDLSQEERVKHWEEPYLRKLEEIEMKEQPTFEEIFSLSRKMLSIRSSYQLEEKNNLYDLINPTIERYRLILRKDNIPINFTHSKEELNKIHLLCNEEIINHILSNILNNAKTSLTKKVERSEKDSIDYVPHIDINIEFEPNAMYYPLKITVRDNGIGIDQEKRKELLSQSFEIKTPGGFGLYFIKGMMQRIGGVIDIDGKDMAYFEITLKFPVDTMEIIF